MRCIRVSACLSRAIPHLGDESRSITVYDPCRGLLDSVCWDCVQNFFNCVYQRLGLEFSFLVVSTSGFGIWVMPDLQNEFGIVYSSSIFFLEEFEKDGC